VRLTEYFANSKTVEASLISVLPLVLLYEALAFSLNAGFAGDIRTGVDLLLRNKLIQLGLPASIAFYLLIVAILVILIRREGWQFYRKVSVSRVTLTAFEGLLYGAFLGLTVKFIAGDLLSSNWQVTSGRFIESLTVNLGAGVYEELLFRLMVITAIIQLFSKSNSTNRCYFCGRIN